MFGLKDFSVDFLTTHHYVVWPVLLLLIVLTIALYRRTNPPLPTYLKIILGALRIVAVVALVLALLEPVFSYTRVYQRPRQIALLLDDSGSMSRIEQGKSRRARRDSLLSTDTFAAVRNTADLTSFNFGGNLVTVSNKVDRDRTSLGAALYELDKHELGAPSDYWLLFTDGRSNSGRHPTEVATNLHTPIVVVDIVSSMGSFDAGINEIDFNPVVFVGRKTEVVIKLNWHQGKNRNIKVELLQGNHVLDSERFLLSNEGGLGEVSFTYVPSEPGQQILKAQVVPIEGEESVDNNQRSFSVKVLKSRLLILIVSEHPDYEAGFLKRYLEQSDKFDVEFIAVGPHAGNLSGRFPNRQTELNRYDLVILHDPDPRRLEPRKDIIRSYLSKKGGAIWVLMGEKFAKSPSRKWLDRLLPFSPSHKKQFERAEFHAEPSEGQLFHPAIRLADDQSAIRTAWSQLPPFQSLVVCDTVDPNSVVLAWAPRALSRSEKWPVLGYKRLGPGKILASAALPYWTWGFVNLGFGEDDTNFGRFVDGTASWLTAKDDFDPIRLVPEKEVFTRGETVRFNGFAYDLGYRPIPGVTGTVTLSPEDGGESFEVDLSALGDGKYTAEFFNLIPEKYRYRAVFEKDGRELKTSKGQLLVESFSIEEYDQSGDPAGLTAIAKLSGGKYYHMRQFDEAMASLDLSSVDVHEKREFNLWGRFWLLAVLIGALAIEWMLRKINQLV